MFVFYFPGGGGQNVLDYIFLLVAPLRVVITPAVVPSSRRAASSGEWSWDNFTIGFVGYSFSFSSHPLRSIYYGNPEKIFPPPLYFKKNSSLFFAVIRAYNKQENKIRIVSIFFTTTYLSFSLLPYLSFLFSFFSVSPFTLSKFFPGVEFLSKLQRVGGCGVMARIYIPTPLS